MGVLLAYRKCFVPHRGIESDKRNINLYTARNEKSKCKQTRDILDEALKLHFICT